MGRTIPLTSRSWHAATHCYAAICGAAMSFVSAWAGLAIGASAGVQLGALAMEYYPRGLLCSSSIRYPICPRPDILDLVT